MTKKFFTLAIATILTLGMSSFAQSPTEGNPTKSECKRDGKKCDKKKCDKSCDKKGDKKGDKKCDKKCGKHCANPFEGLNLTPEQQTKLQSIPTPAQVMKAARDQKSDGQASPEMRRQVVRDIRSNYLKQVSAVLTPEQYVQFLESNYINQSPAKPGKGDKKGDRKCDKKKGDRKGDRRGDSPRGDRGQQSK
ncbi:MAG: hypothetical protein NC111_05040 [Bacteroides sp.]|nr:hypothetical protein [Bacteroides sp.]MCM1413693.1 hypothetical protein [Bacteroides sp.]MCM1471872.1 hypothetical protein [Bacteroides sp.]